MATTDAKQSVDATGAVVSIAQLICADLAKMTTDVAGKSMTLDQARQLQVYAKTLTEIHDWRAGVVEAAAKKLTMDELMAKLKGHPEVARLMGDK